MISMPEPELSVITACFNHGKFIHEMLDSVLNQTFPDFEIIIVNDGSTDDTADILDKIANEKVRVIHIENRGPAFARNLAIENARAPVIMNLDADDKIAPGLLEKAYNIFTSNPDIGIVYCDAEYFGAKSGKYEIGEYSPEEMLIGNRIISQAFFRKEDWRSVGGYSDKLLFGLEDWDLWLSIIELGRFVYKIPEKLVYYRTYKNPFDCRSGRRKKDRLKLMRSLVIIFHRHEKLYSVYPEVFQQFAQIEEKLKNENSILRLLKNLYFNNFRKIQ
jgi:glycosyltransferase involved in cell wall biosynthesis